MAQIIYEIPFSFKGRNGTYTCKGIDIYDADPTRRGSYSRIVLQPITSRDEIGSCFIDFPKNKIQELIEILENLK